MTSSEYAAAYRNARATLPLITRRTMRELRRTYIAAAEQAAAKVWHARMVGASDLTADSWAQIEEALQLGAREIQRHLDEQLPLAVKDIAGKVTHIDETYLMDAITRSGVGLKRIAVSNLFVDASDKVLRSLVNRVFSDGYSYSERIWRVGERYTVSMKRVLSAGIASGRDVKEVAKDLTVYVQKGKGALAQRWGNLVGSELQRRVGSAGVDYQALRLVRTELYTSMRDASVLDASINPASTGWFDWIRTNGTDWGCECPGWAAGGPYTEEQINEMNAATHPNCFCYPSPRLMDSNEFIRDLRAWDAGKSVGYLDDWYSGVYQKAA